MSKKVGIERRKYVRLDTEVKIECLELRGKKEKIPAITKNISVQGVCFSSNREFKPKTAVRLNVFIPGYSKPICLKGRIVWCKVVPTKQKGLPLFDTGVKLVEIEKTNETKFFMYVLDKVVEIYSKQMNK